MSRKTQIAHLAALTGTILLASIASAQPPYSQQPPYGQAPEPYYGAAPAFNPAQLDGLVARIALYPDPLLAEILTASTFPDQIQATAGWAHQHRYLAGDELAGAISMDRLPYDPSVLGLIPFPMVLDMLAMDPGWTQQLGSAVLADRPSVMDAVQRMRQRAWDAGYLRETPQLRVVRDPGGWIDIEPTQAGYYYVPYYNPSVVYVRPARGVVFGAGISFGPRIFIGASFAPFGWREPHFDWRARTVVIDNHPWQRTWVNRQQYVHPYATPAVRPAGPRIEHHDREIERREGPAPRVERERPREREREHER